MEAKYQKGEYVVYGTNGIYCIDDISEVDFSREKGQLFYILKPISRKHSTVYVPLDKEIAVGKIRYPLTKEEIDRVLLNARDMSIDWVDDRNGRASLFREILTSGKHERLITMSCCIRARRDYLAAINKKLSVTDEKALHDAEQQINEELSYVLQIEESEVEDYVVNGLGLHMSPVDTKE